MAPILMAVGNESFVVNIKQNLGGRIKEAGVYIADSDLKNRDTEY